MLKHPKELGFTLGLTIRISVPASIVATPDATARDVVYVALLAGNRKTIKKGDALRVGQTKRSLKSRWKGIAGIFSRDNLRDFEMEDRRKLLAEANGKEVAVWVKAAGKTTIPYAKGLTRSNRFSTRCAEEEFLDQYYQPKLGIRLNKRSDAR
jgi:hypothetical protein